MIRLIVNPTSGRGKAAILAEDVLRSLERRGAAARVFPTRARGDAEAEARRFSREAAAGAVICIGGDGTVNEVANGLRGSEIPFAVLPMGTANMLAGEFGIRPDPKAAAEAVLAGSRVRLDAGRWGGRIFLCVAGVGFDAEVARRYAAVRRWTGGYPGYVLPILGTLAEYVRPRFAVEVDGRPVGRECAWVLASNTRRYGGPLRFAPDASPVDGLLDLAATTRGGVFPEVRYLLLAATGAFRGAPGTIHGRGLRIAVRPLAGRAPVQLDGDFAGTCEPDAPAVFEIVPGAVTLLVPPRMP
jgi:diacylglycerol kinase (ATP)